MEDCERTFQSGKEEESAGRWWTIAGRVAIYLLFASAAVLTLVYGLRSPLVLADVAAPKLEQAAREAGADLEVGAMGGASWTGVRLYDVELSTASGGVATNLSAPTVEIFPDIRASLAAKRPVIKQVSAPVVTINIAQGTDDLQEDASPSAVQGDTGGGLERWFNEEFEVTVDAVSVGMDGIDHRAEFEQVGALINLPQHQIEALWGEGSAAGVEFVLTSTEESVIAELVSPSLDAVTGELPVELTVEAIAVDQQTLRDLVATRRIDDFGVELHNLRAASPHLEDVAITARRSTVQGDDTSIRWSAPMATIESGERSYRLNTSELAYRRDAGGFEFLTEIDDKEGGSIELQGQWHLPTSLVGINAWIHDFSWDGAMPWPFGDQSPVQQAKLDGAVHGDIDLVHGLISLDGEIHSPELTILFPVLADGELTFRDVEVALPLTVDARSEAVSVVNGVVSIGEFGPFELDGQIIEAGGGTHVFDLAAIGDEIDASNASENLPEAMTGVIAETSVEGDFGLQVQMAGHSGYPESLLLEADFWGDLDVTEDAQWRDQDLFRAREVVLFDGEGQPQKVATQMEWKELAELPSFIPGAVIAAEDTAFLEHDGLDWKGLRMAMVENIQERALVRGGSTITQQVAKNLFLTHDRTLFRKLQEAFLAWRVEETLSKNEILELYLNIVEWGPQIHGISAASHYFFDRPPVELSPLEIVALASILPSPIRFGGAITQGYLPSSRADKMRRVLENMRFVEDLSWEQYHAALAELNEGRIGGLELSICADDDTAKDDAMPCDEIEVQDRDGDVFEYEHDQWMEQVGGMEWTPLTY